MPPWTIWFSFDRLYSNKCFVVFKQVLWNSSNLNYWSYHYRMVERMIEFLSSSAKLPCELLSFQVVSGNMDWPYNELIADYDKVNFVIMLTWMSYIVMFLTGRRTAQHWLISSEFGRQRNFLISMKSDLRQTPISSCSLSFCIVLVIWLLKVLYTEDCLGFTAFTVCLSVSHTSHSSRSTCPLVRHMDIWIRLVTYFSPLWCVCAFIKYFAPMDIWIRLVTYFSPHWCACAFIKFLD